MSNVIHLAYSTADTELGVESMIACKHCKNKTYTLVYQTEGSFPLLKCAACGCHISNIGFVE